MNTFATKSADGVILPLGNFRQVCVNVDVARCIRCVCSLLMLIVSIFIFFSFTPLNQSPRGKQLKGSS